MGIERQHAYLKTTKLGRGRGTSKNDASSPSRRIAYLLSVFLDRESIAGVVACCHALPDVPWIARVHIAIARTDERLASLLTVLSASRSASAIYGHNLSRLTS